MFNKVASIKFLPVCTRCNEIIWTEIGHRYIPAHMPEGTTMFFPAESVIKPERCPNCGAWFEGIVMPTKLPYDNRRLK